MWITLWKEVGKMVLCENRRELITKNGIIELTFYEYRFIKYLIDNKNRNCTYKELIMYIYNVDENTYNLLKNSFSVMLKRVRKKIKNENLLIKTIHNYGIFIIYKIDYETKKKFKRYEYQIEIYKLKQEILEKQEKIKILEDKINER